MNKIPHLELLSPWVHPDKDGEALQGGEQSRSGEGVSQVFFSQFGFCRRKSVSVCLLGEGKFAAVPFGCCRLLLILLLALIVDFLDGLLDGKKTENIAILFYTWSVAKCTVQGHLKKINHSPLYLVGDTLVPAPHI